MKTSLCFSLTIATLAFVFSPASGTAAPAAGTNAVIATTSSNSIPQSVFTIPTSKAEGCDPFFPTSTRLWASTDPTPVAASQQTKSTGVDCITLKGLAGVPSNPLAMINGRPMARGEDAEINTDCGRLLVHCVDITTNSAIIEVGGERRELHLRSDF